MVEESRAGNFEPSAYGMTQVFVKATYIISHSLFRAFTTSFVPHLQGCLHFETVE
jgi:hypothetical protein